MKDENKTKKRDLNELMDLRRQKTKVTKAESNRKRKDEKQEKLEARLRTVIESLPFDFFGIDAKGRYFIQNTTCKNRWGDIIGKRTEDLSVDKNILSLWLDNNRRAFSGEIVKGEVEFIREGEKRYYYNIIAPIYNKGLIDGILGFNVDITERKQAEEEKERILTLSNDLICIMGTDGYFKYVNPAWERILGYSREELLSKSVFDFVHHDDRQQNYKDFFALVASGKQTVGYENHLLHKDGSIRLLSWTGTPLPEKKLIYCIGHDITERKKAEEALQEREKELQIEARNLEEANVALKVLLKRRDEDKAELEDNVLLNIKGLVNPYLEKLKMSGLDKSQKAYLTILESSLNQVTSSFLHRLSFNYSNFTPTEIQVANLLKQGKTNKEIGELLNSSSRTIAFHRDNIRKKLGLKNKKTNLKSYLLSLQ